MPLNANTPDVNDCDREPIHSPGAIQPHGVLLVFDETLTLVGGAAATIPILELCGRSAKLLLGDEAADRLASVRDPTQVVVGSVAFADAAFEMKAVRAPTLWLVQLEPAAEPSPPSIDILNWLNAAGGALGRAADLRELCQVAADRFRDITRYDRVMIYRFLDDGSGVVIAESRRPELASFLHHHFPASDIPQQARALYVRNRVRVIPDVAYTAAPIVGTADALNEVDLSDIDLRSVSPIHVQYLKNMGVGASASVSIVRDGLLWGLVACHAAEPRPISLHDRILCETLAGALARQLRAKEDADLYRDRVRVRGLEDVVGAQLQVAATVSELLDLATKSLREMLNADGFAVVRGPSLDVDGDTPDRRDVRLVADWVFERAVTGEVFHTACLGKHFPEAAEFRELASGLMALVLSTEERVALLWFRAEHRQTVEWAGNPHKGAGPDGQLTPRASFDLWVEETRGLSRDWTLSEIEAAQRLSRHLLNARQAQRVKDLNRELAATVAEKDALLLQKDNLLKEVNHRVQNSLQLVQSFLTLQTKASAEPGLGAALEEAQRRISAVALVHRRLYSDDSVQTVDLGRYLGDLCADLKASSGPEWARQMTVEVAPLLISADHAVNVGLVLTELIINAQKYAYGGKPGPIAVTLEPYRNRFQLVVADHGKGRTGTRTGFGTRMIKAMVGSLRGVVEEADNHPGMRTIVTAPLRRADMP